jgi:hypothetical protein
MTKTGFCFEFGILNLFVIWPVFAEAASRRQVLGTWGFLFLCPCPLCPFPNLLVLVLIDWKLLIHQYSNHDLIL